MMDEFRVSATGHSLNYLPEYLAKANGIFKKHDLSVSVSVPQPWTQVLIDINTRQAHAALGGIWVPSMYYGRVKDYIAFAQVSERCPLSIVGRASEDNFSLKNMSGATVLITGGTGPSPYLFLSGLIEEAGVARSNVRIVHDLATPMLLELFKGGMGDYLVVDPLTAGRLVEEGAGVLSGSLAEIGGAVPWSVYYAPPDRFEEESGLYSRFSTAVNEAMAVLRNVSAAELVPLLGGLWPGVPASILTSVVERFQSCGMWATGCKIQNGPFDRWQGIIAAHGLVAKPLSMADIVDGGAASARL